MGIQIIDIDLGFDKITHEIAKLGKSKTEIGLFGSGGTPANDVASRGAVHEFGTTKIPKRSFLASTFDDEADRWWKFSLILLKKIFDGSWDAKKLLQSLSQKAQDNIMTKIELGIPPPNSLKTIKRKKSSKTLIDTGDMKNRITYKIGKK